MRPFETEISSSVTLRQSASVVTTCTVAWAVLARAAAAPVGRWARPRRASFFPLTSSRPPSAPPARIASLRMPSAASSLSAYRMPGPFVATQQGRPVGLHTSRARSTLMVLTRRSWSSYTHTA